MLISASFGSPRVQLPTLGFLSQRVWNKVAASASVWDKVPLGQRVWDSLAPPPDMARCVQKLLDMADMAKGYGVE